MVTAVVALLVLVATVTLVQGDRARVTRRRQRHAAEVDAHWMRRSRQGGSP